MTLNAWAVAGKKQLPTKAAGETMMSPASNIQEHVKQRPF
jgi:hypothetical protein